MAATRATEMFIIVGSHESLPVFPEFWHALMRFNNTPKTPLPYIVQYISELSETGRSFIPKTQVVHEEDYMPPKYRWKNKKKQRS